jgi:hypothetical protein
MPFIALTFGWSWTLWGIAILLGKASAAGPIALFAIGGPGPYIPHMSRAISVNLLRRGRPVSRLRFLPR